VSATDNQLSQITEEKIAVADAASDLVESGMRVGLGTGSTALFVIHALAKRLRNGALHDLAMVPTSTQAQLVCWEQGLTLSTLSDPVIAGSLDITIDGADEVDSSWNLIKGGGGALLNEKIVARASGRYVIAVNEYKLVPRLGVNTPVPVEVVPFALAPVKSAIEEFGYRAELRLAVRKQGPVMTDNGNMIIDAWAPPNFDAVKGEIDLIQIPGVVENGLFTRCVTDLFVGSSIHGVNHKRRK